ncbi:MAG: Osmoregulated proline transporter OpuE [Chlamydiae bacterium]|nr:Osmoregulated proline transporter OpuE [Chlamydiota bacterium]
MHYQVIFSFAIYFSILLAIGLFSHKKSQTEVDFILGNRSLNFWLTALSAHASDMSAWLFMAMPAAIFIGGIPHIWMALGLLIGMFLNWQFVAPKLRTLTEEYKSNTLSTFFEKRFRDESGTIRLVTAFLSLVFLTCYLSAGLIAMGYLFESLFSINFYVGIVIAVSVVIAYTFVGGFVAVAWTDLFQGFFLLFMVLMVPLVALSKIGGIGSVISNAASQGISLQIMDDYSTYSFVSIIMIVLGWGLGYFGQPHIITKFMGIRDVSEIWKAKFLGMTWQFLALGGAIFVGVVGIGYFPEGLANGELVFVDMVKSLFHPFIGGIILCAVLAANISTMDSQILVCASVITEDLYKRYYRRQAESSELLKISRTSVVFIGILAFIFATSKSATVTGAVFYAWGGLGSAFGPLVLTSLYSTSVNRYGALAGIIVGGVLAGTWDLMNPYFTTFVIPPMVPAFTLSLISILIVSKMTRKNEKINHENSKNYFKSSDNSRMSKVII